MKTLMMAAATAFALSATAAAAQTAGDNTADINLSGTIAVSCTVTPDVRNVNDINLDQTTSRDLGSLTYRCNAPGGFTRTISSLNGGNLKNGSTTIPYTFAHGGGSGLNVAPPVSLATNNVESFNGSGAFVSGQTGTASIIVNKAGAVGPLYAGAYTDTITVTIVPNS